MAGIASQSMFLLYLLDGVDVKLLDVGFLFLFNVIQQLLVHNDVNKSHYPWDVPTTW